MHLSVVNSNKIFKLGQALVFMLYTMMLLTKLNTPECKKKCLLNNLMCNELYLFIPKIFSLPKLRSFGTLPIPIGWHLDTKTLIFLINKFLENLTLTF